MKILPVCSKNMTPCKTAFKSTERTFFDASVQDSFCQGEVSNYTSVFRDDIEDWVGFVDEIINNFDGKRKINVYCLGCSDASEPYSYATLFKKYENQHSLFPIIAVDKNRDIIKHVKKGRINLSGEDIAKINIILGVEQNYFTDMRDEVIIKDRYYKTINDWYDREFPKYYSYKVSDELRSLVNFKVRDMVHVAANITDDSNTFISSRNLLPYITLQDRIDYVNSLNKNLKKGSLVALGEYDERVDASKMLLNNNFIRTKFKYLYKKIA